MSIVIDPNFFKSSFDDDEDWVDLASLGGEPLNLRVSTHDEPCRLSSNVSEISATVTPVSKIALPTTAPELLLVTQVSTLYITRPEVLNSRSPLPVQHLSNHRHVQVCSACVQPQITRYCDGTSQVRSMGICGRHINAFR